MTKFSKLSVLLLPVALGACAVARPDGPSVLALPGKGRDLASFNAQEANCRTYADAQIGPNEAARGTDAAVGTAVVGTAVGAAAGALIGSASGNVGAGAAVGAGTGLVAGSAIGAGGAQASSGNLQDRYDAAYIQCITSSGNTVSLPEGPEYSYGYPYPYAVGAYPYYYGAVAPFPFYYRFGGPRFYGPRYGFYGRGGGYYRGGGGHRGGGRHR